MRALDFLSFNQIYKTTALGSALTVIRSSCAAGATPMSDHLLQRRFQLQVSEFFRNFCVPVIV
jgi:hypothetical protein